MKFGSFWLVLYKICSNSTNFDETHQNKRKLGKIRRNSTNYILIKSMLIGAQGEFLRNFFFFAELA